MNEKKQAMYLQM